MLIPHERYSDSAHKGVFGMCKLDPQGAAHWNLTGVLPGNSNRVTGRKIITGKRPFLTGVIAQPGLSTATGYPCPNRTNMLKSSTQSNRGELVTGSGGV